MFRHHDLGHDDDSPRCRQPRRVGYRGREPDAGSRPRGWCAQSRATRRLAEERGHPIDGRTGIRPSGPMSPRPIFPPRWSRQRSGRTDAGLRAANGGGCRVGACAHTSHRCGAADAASHRFTPPSITTTAAPANRAHARHGEQVATPQNVDNDARRPCNAMGPGADAPGPIAASTTADDQSKQAPAP